MSQPASATLPAAAALYIAVLQALFVTTWTVYVIFLPRLLVMAGLPAAWAPWVLLLDQLVFMVADVATGLYADRVQRRLGRIGPWVVGATAVSCCAFLLLPHAARLGAAAAPLALGLILVWTATSSALRAPPWVLLDKYAARPALPWLNSLTLLGLAVGGAVAPFLGVALKNADPRWPFALSSLTLLLATAGIVYLEKLLTQLPSARQQVAAAAPALRQLGAQHAVWLLGVLLLAAAYQIHASINAAANYLRFAPPAGLEWLMPMFWVGFGAASLPCGALCRRYGSLAVMTVAALVGAGAAVAAAGAASLPALVMAQLLAGAAWAGMMAAMFASAAALGHTGREGAVLGAMFAALALATVVRLAAVLGGLPKDAVLAPVLAWLPSVLWLLGGAVVAWLAWRARPAGVAPASV